MKLINKNIESAFLPIKGGSQSANPCTEPVEVRNIKKLNPSTMKNNYSNQNQMNSQQCVRNSQFTLPKVAAKLILNSQLATLNSMFATLNS
jgi:hypothetical protein